MPKSKEIHLKDDFSEVDLAYIAGIVDGEAYLGLNKVEELRRSNITISYQTMLKIAMSDSQAVEFMKDCFGGTIFIRKSIVKGIQYRNQFVWQISKQSELKKILLIILPYLKVKRTSALLVLDYICLRERKKQVTWKNNYNLEEKKLYLESKEILKGIKNS